MEGILIDIRLSRAKVFCLLTTNRRKLSRQDANCVSGNSVGKTITETFPAVGLDVWNTVLGPAQLYFVPGLTLRSTNSRRLGLSIDSFGIGTPTMATAFATDAKGTNGEGTTLAGGALGTSG